MARLLLGHDEEAGRFVAERSPIEKPIWPAGFVGFGILGSDDKWIAGVVFSDWQEDCRRIELSACADDPHAFSTRILFQLGNYVFGQLNVFRCWARTSTENRRARKFLKGIGFTEESTQAHWYGVGQHCITARVTAPEWQRKWGFSPMKKAA